eukprot:199279-Chlamydomonas_euryale.AAC.8
MRSHLVDFTGQFTCAACCHTLLTATRSRSCDPRKVTPLARARGGIIKFGCGPLWYSGMRISPCAVRGARHASSSSSGRSSSSTGGSRCRGRCLDSGRHRSCILDVHVSVAAGVRGAAGASSVTASDRQGVALRLCAMPKRMSDIRLRSRAMPMCGGMHMMPSAYAASCGALVSSAPSGRVSTASCVTRSAAS